MPKWPRSRRGGDGPGSLSSGRRSVSDGARRRLFSARQPRQVGQRLGSKTHQPQTKTSSLTYAARRHAGNSRGTDICERDGPGRPAPNTRSLGVPTAGPGPVPACGTRASPLSRQNRVTRRAPRWAPGAFCCPRFRRSHPRTPRGTAAAPGRLQARRPDASPLNAPQPPAPQNSPSAADTTKNSSLDTRRPAPLLEFVFKLPFLIKVITSHVDEPRDPQKTARSSSVPRRPPLRRALSVILKVVGTSPWGGAWGCTFSRPPGAAGQALGVRPASSGVRRPRGGSHPEKRSCPPSGPTAGGLSLPSRCSRPGKPARKRTWK